MKIVNQESNSSSRIHRIQGEFGASEDWLQEYLGNNPNLLPMRDLEGIESNLRLIGRELSNIDLLFADEKGLLTIVETKLAESAELRRDFVGQLLSYAATLKKWDVGDLCLRVATLGEKDTEGLPELRKLSEAMHKHVHNGRFTEESAGSAKTILSNYVLEGEVKEPAKRTKKGDSFLNNLNAMLAEGSFRLVLVTYEVSSQTLDLLNYVNSTTQRGHQLVAVELSREDLQDGLHFIPHLVGAPQALSAVYYREEVSERVYGSWTTEQFVKALPDSLASDASGLISAIDHKKDELWYRTGTGKSPSMLLGSNVDTKHALLAVYADGTATLYSKVGTDQLLQGSQKEALLSLYASTPFLRETHRKVVIGIKQKKPLIEPVIDLKDVGKKDERWKLLLELLEQYHRIISTE